MEKVIERPKAVSLKWDTKDAWVASGLEKGEQVEFAARDDKGATYLVTSKRSREDDCHDPKLFAYAGKPEKLEEVRLVGWGIDAKVPGSGVVAVAVKPPKGFPEALGWETIFLSVGSKDNWLDGKGTITLGNIFCPDAGGNLGCTVLIAPGSQALEVRPQSPRNRNCGG